MSTKTYYRLASFRDISEARTLDLRESDKKEALAMSGLPWQETLKLSIENSKYTFVGIHEEKIECVFGLIELEKKVAAPWFATTDKFNEFGFTFAKESKKLINRWLEVYPILNNYVSADHIEAVNWLKWLGFKFDDTPVVFADPTVEFYRFYIYKED